MKIGIVLSAGMARGSLQVGALEAVREYVQPQDIDYCSCASIGALNAYGFLTNRLPLLKSLWSDASAKNDRLLVHHAVKSSLLQNSIARLCVSGDQFTKPFYIPLLNMKSKVLEYTDISAMPPEMYPAYLHAGISIPIYQKPFQIGSSLYSDGGFVDNVPIYPLYKKELDYIICIYFEDFGYAFENAEFDKKIIKLPLPLKKGVHETFVLDKSELEEMTKRGYNAAKERLDVIFQNGIDDLDCIRRTTALLNKNNFNSYRITREVIICNLNKLTKQISKKRVLV